MFLVIDANVIFSALISRGRSFEVFEANKIFNTFELIAPEFLFLEIGNRMDKILSLSKLSKVELSKVLSFIKSETEFISFSEFSDKMPGAMQLNLKDSPYLALAIKLKCPILSGDKGLKEQERVKILSPSEALSIIYDLK